MSKQIVIEVGTIFGRLIVLNGNVGSNKHGRILVSCRCECETELNILSSKLRNGHTQSCGCLQKEKASKVNISHGLSDTRTYRIWKGIKTRCFDLNCKDYKYYGGRGITICESWKNSFEIFLKDMGECPDGMSIERVNNRSGYSPDNCVWATAKEQNNNSRNVRAIEHLGETKSLTQWALDYNINMRTLRGRLEKGWDIEKALTTPVKKKQ